MGAYSFDRSTSSPKKSALPRGSLSFLEVRRRLSSRRYFCVWVMMALIPCYLLRQMFFYESPATEDTYARDPEAERLAASTTTSIPYDKSIGLQQQEAAAAVGRLQLDEADEKPMVSGMKPRAEVEDKVSEDEYEKRAAQVRQPASKKKSVLDFIFRPNTIKPAQYKEGHATGNKGLANSLKLKLKENFEDEENFGVAEDNDKAEEQSWTAPPAPSKPEDKTLLGKR